MNFESIYSFWFKELSKEQWFKKDSQLDEDIKRRFWAIHAKAVQCELFEWRSSAKGRLCEVIILDQFPRNMFRDSALAFASDSLALCLAQEAVNSGFDKELNPSEKAFLYMPYMHSESPLIHKKAVELFSQPGLEFNLDYEIQHKNIIDRFGRYPHRNRILNRISTEEELEFLKEKNSSF